MFGLIVSLAILSGAIIAGAGFELGRGLYRAIKTRLIGRGR